MNVKLDPKVVGAVLAVAVALLIGYLWDENQTTAVAARTVREASPLILAALCGLIGERSGIINIGIEGQMLMAAFFGFMAASFTENLFIGLAAAVLAASLAGLFLAWTSIQLKMDQIIAGTIVNIFGLGVTSFLYSQGRTMPSIPNWTIPKLEEIPVLGSMLFDHGPFTYASILAVVVVHIAVFKTRWGLRTRAVGEHPGAADTVGVKVSPLRYKNLAIAGILAGFAGMALLQSASVFNRNMTNGKGFIALAVMIFGRYRPAGVLGAALLFGFFQGLQSQLQFKQTFDVPPQFFGMIPFVLTIAVLAIAGLSVRPPAAAGQVYETE